MAIAFRSVGAVGTGTNPTAGVPGTRSVGDLFVLVTTGTAAPTAPTGWTLVYAQGAGRFLTVYYKICSSSESNLALTQTGTTSKAVILCYSGSGNYDVVGTVNTGTSTSPATLSQTTKSANDFVMSIYAVTSGSASTLTANASTTSRITSAATAGVNGLLVADETKATAGATTARTASQTASVAWAAISISIRETQTLYWTGTGNWNSTSLWRTSSGGATQANPPGQGDNVVIDGNSTSLTISTAAICNNLYVSTATFTGTLAGTSTLTIYGSLTCDAGNAGGTYSYSGDITFAAVTGSGNKTIDTYDQSFFNKNNITFNGVGGIWLLASDLGDTSLTANKTLTLTSGAFSLQNHVCYFNAFSASGTLARTLDFSGAGGICVFGTNKTVIDIGTTTNLTVLGIGYYLSTPGATSTGTRTITLGNIYTIANAPDLTVATDVGDTVSITATSIRELSFAAYYIGGASVTTISNTALTVFGSLSLPALGASFTSGTNAWTFAATSQAFFYVNNNTLNIPLIFNGVGGNWRFFGSLTQSVSTRSVTLTNGTIDLFGYSLTCGTFSSSNANLREIKSGDVYVLSNATTIWDTTTATNLSVTNVNLYSQYAGATGTRTIVTPATQTAVPSVIINAGTDTVSLTSAYNVELTGFGGTLSNITRSIFGSFTASSSGTFSMTAGTNITSFRATSSVYITSNNELFDFPLIFDGSGGTWALNDNLTVGSTRTVTFTTGTLDFSAGAYSLTCGTFTSSTTGVRAMSFGSSGGKLVVVTAGTPLNINGTNLTVTGTSRVDVSVNSATATTVTLNTGFTETNALNVYFTTGTYTLTETATTPTYKNLNFTGFSGTFPNNTRTIYGNFYVSGTMTLTGGANITTFGGISSYTITTNAKTLDFPVTFDGVGGTWTLQDALTMGNRQTTLINGTLDLGNFNYTTGTFSSNYTNIRGLTFGTGQMYITNNGNAIVYRMDALANVTISGAGTVNFTGAGVNPNTRFIYHGTTNGTNDKALSFNLTSGTDTVYLGGYWYDVTFTSGFTGITSLNANISGNFSLANTITSTTSTNGINFVSTSGIKTITTNGITVDQPVGFNGVGGTWKLIGALTVGTTRTVTLTNGALDLNNNNFTCGFFSSNNSNTRSIAFGTGQFYITGSNGGAWRTDSAIGLTFTGTPTVNLTYSGGTGTRSVLSASGSGTYNTAINLNVTGGATDIITSSGSPGMYANVNFSGFSGSSTWFGNILGNLTLSNTMTQVTTSPLNLLNYTGTQNVTSNGATIDSPVTFGQRNTITGASGDGTTVTITSGSTINYVYPVGATVEVQSVIPTAYNGTYTVTASTLTSVSFLSSTTATYTSGGSIYLGTTVNLLDQLTVGSTKTTTLNKGTFNLNNNNLYTGFFGSAQPGTRTLAFGTAQMYLTGNAGSIFNNDNGANMTITGSAIINATYTGGTGTRLIDISNSYQVAEANTLSVNITGGTDSFTLYGFGFKNVNWTGFAGTMTTTGQRYVYGNWTFSTGMTVTTGSGLYRFFGSGTQLITNNGKSYGGIVYFGNATLGGGTFILQDAMSCDSFVQFDCGTLDLNNNNLTAVTFSSNNSYVRTFAFNGGQFYLTGTNATIWNTNTITNATITGTPIINATGAGTAGQTRVFANGAAGGGSEATSFILNVNAGSDALNIGNPFYSRGYNFTGFSGTLGTTTVNYYVYGNIVFSPTMSLFAGSGWSIFPSNSTANVTSNGITIDANIVCGSLSPATPNCVVNFVDALTLGSTRTFSIANGTVKFPAGVTNTVGALTTQGTTMKYIRSTVPGTRAFLSDASGTNYVSYLDVQDSYATGGGVFDAINPSNVDSGNNLGWGFSSSNPFIFFY